MVIVFIIFAILSITADEDVEEVTSYHSGPKDICSVFFYLLIAVVLHAVVQEYLLDVSHTVLLLFKV